MAAQTRLLMKVAARLAHGLRGLWDRLSGKYARTRRQNEWEAWQGHVRDRDERDDLVQRQLDQRRALQHDIRLARSDHTKEMLLLHRDVADYMQMAGREPAQPPPGRDRAADAPDMAGERQGPELGL